MFTIPVFSRRLIGIVAAVCALAFGLSQAQDTAPAVKKIISRDRNIVLGPAGLRGVLRGSGGGWLAGQPDPDPDSNESDKSAWQVFIAINKLAPSQQSVGPSNVTSNNAIWETWADDALTFPAAPNLASPPQWPATATTFPLKQLRLPEQNLLRRLQIQGKPPISQREFMRQLQIAHPGVTVEQLFKSAKPLRSVKPESFRPEIELVQTGGGEEVRRNQASFNFIIANNLWYTQGLAAAFAAGNVITFPVNAIEIKARWKPIQPSEMSQYHWNYDSTGALYGLVALHIMTKALPNWLWATWEWTGNAGRCDYIGCNDSFGAAPAVVPPTTPLNGQYPAGSLTPALSALFTAAGLGAEWQNYRLKGSQTSFANTTGQPTLLGNSVTEAGFVQSSSCITCHGQASVDKNGAPNPSVGFLPNHQSSNGPLIPSMFYNNANPPQLQYLPIDFVWGILAANPAP